MKRFISFLVLLCLVVTLLPANIVRAAGVPKFKLGGYTVTKKATVYESKRVKINVEKNIYVPNTILSDIENIMSTIEKETKLSYYPKGKEAKVNVDVTRFNKEIGTELIASYGEYRGVTVSPADILIRAGETYALVHELLHCIYYRNSNSVALSTFMMEGFATYFSMKIIDEKNLVFSNSYIHLNFSGMEIEPDKNNVEELLNKIDAWESYKLGYRFFYYLHTQVSETAYKNILKMSRSSFKENTQVNVNDTIKFIKSLYGKDIFAEFGAWYENEMDTLFSNGYIKDYSENEVIERYPVLGAASSFLNIHCIYKDSIVFDFRRGFEYLQNFIKKKPIGIYGTMYMVGQAKVEFCDEKGKCLKSYENSNENINISIKGASIIRITGDGQIINFTFDYDKMVK